MDSPKHSRAYTKWDAEDGSDVKSDRAGDDDDWEGVDKRKHRSSRSRKSGNGEEVEGIDLSGRRKSIGDRNEGRKKSSGSSRADSEEDDYDSRKEQHTKQTKKKQEESSLDKLSSWYGEVENKQDGGDKSGSRGQNRIDESERRKMTSKNSEHEGSHSKSKNKEENSHDGELEKMLDRDSKYSDKKESGREKSHGSTEHSRSARRRWDETDVVRKVEESNSERADSRSGKASDPKYESPRGKSASARNETSESRSRGLDLNTDKGTKLINREERKADAERSKSKGKSEIVEEDDRGSPITREDRSTREKSEKHKQQRSSGRDVSESRERSFNADDDGSTWVKDKGAREAGNANRSRTPERSGRRQHDSEHSDMDYEKSFKRKELEKDGYKDDRAKGKDENWSERSRDREGSKESWKRRQSSSNDKEAKNGEVGYEHGRDWEIPRHGRERGDSERHNERPLGRSGNRKG